MARRRPEELWWWRIRGCPGGWWRHEGGSVSCVHGGGCGSAHGGCSGEADRLRSAMAEQGRAGAASRGMGWRRRGMGCGGNARGR